MILLIKKAHLSVSHYDEYVCASIHGLPLWGSMQMVEADAYVHVFIFLALRRCKNTARGVNCQDFVDHHSVFPLSKSYFLFQNPTTLSP